MGTCILLRNSVFIGHASSPLNLCKGGFPSGAANAGDLRDQVPSLGREDPLEEKMATHSSILENPMDRGATVYSVVKSQTLLNSLRTNTQTKCGVNCLVSTMYFLGGKGTKEDEMVGRHHRLNGHESEQAPGVGDGQGTCLLHGSQRVGHD